MFDYNRITRFQVHRIKSLPDSNYRDSRTIICRQHMRGALNKNINFKVNPLCCSDFKVNLFTGQWRIQFNGDALYAFASISFNSVG
jgi:hypothetical protein